MHDDTDPTTPELTRLADGTLPAAEAARLRERVQGSPRLAAELAEQEQAVSLLRALDTPAPVSLRARIETETDPAARSRRRTRRRPLWMGPGLPAVAVLIVALVITIGGGADRQATIPQTARLALAASTRPAPAADPSAPGRLLIANAGISFPAWHTSTAWRASGARVDELGGRRVVTVFYTSATGGRVGYGIVSGAPLHTVAGQAATRYGVWFTLTHLGAENLITWQRDGHTCVIAGRSVSYAALLSLAAADERPAAA